jgi:hypothetical protein
VPGRIRRSLKRSGVPNGPTHLSGAHIGGGCGCGHPRWLIDAAASESPEKEAAGTLTAIRQLWKPMFRPRPLTLAAANLPGGFTRRAKGHQPAVDGSQALLISTFDTNPPFP